MSNPSTPAAPPAGTILKLVEASPDAVTALLHKALRPPPSPSLAALKHLEELHSQLAALQAAPQQGTNEVHAKRIEHALEAVSYTHLTLPTICSV